MPRGYNLRKMYELAIADIVVGSYQTRTYFGQQEMDELTASVKSHGVLQPVLVQAGEDSKFVLVAGERRFRAAQAAGLSTIPAVVIDGDPYEVTMIENLQRANLTVIEEAEALERLRGSHDYQLNNLCEIFGLQSSTLSEILSLNRLPATVRDDCRNDPKTARGILVEIAKQRSEAKMQALYDKYKKSGLTRGEIRTVARATKPATDAPADITFVDNFLKRLDALDTAKVPQDQQEGLIGTLEKLRSTAFQKLKALKGTAPTPPPA